MAKGEFFLVLTALFLFSGGIRAAQQTSGNVTLSITPNKIFTPNGDGCNDLITFQLLNFATYPSFTGKIFTSQGAFVADLQPSLNFASLVSDPGCTAPYLGGDALAWDGKYSDGKIARKGVYLYRIEAGGKSLRGTVVVAR